MLYVGLDLSRKRIDFHALREDGELVERGALPADPDGLARLVYRLGGHDREVLAVIESMNGARFVHDQLELAGFEVEIADAQRVKGDGDRKASAVYAKAFSENPEFYSFYRSLEAYRAGFKNKSDVLVLEPNADFFKYLKSPGKGSK